MMMTMTEYCLIHFYKRMEKLLCLLLGILLFTTLTQGIKKKYLDSDGDGENDADDDDEDYDGDGIKNKDDEDDDGDGISDKNDKDDDGDGIDDSTGQSYKSGKPEAVSKEKSGAVEGMVFAYFFGL